MKKMTAKIDSKQATYGRPRLLTHDEILEAAVKLGLEGLTMKRLAGSLNVGTATLYQYFDSRKTLMRAAAVYSLSDVPWPEDTGQHWSRLARGYVDSMQTLLSDNPTFINSYQNTDYGFEVRFKLVEQFLQMMSRRGFSAAQGMDLFNIVGMAAFAGAVETNRQREFEFQDETMSVVARRQFERLSDAQFPMMAKALSGFTQTPEQKVESLLGAAFRTIARARGEDENEVI